MPSIVSNQNNYYTAHHRRMSSSQNNLPENGLPATSPMRSPNRSLVYLPSTTYNSTAGLPRNQPNDSPQPYKHSTDPNDLPLESQHRDIPQPYKHSTDPDDFYRTFQDPFVDRSGGSLHQGSIRTTNNELGVGGHEQQNPSQAFLHSVDEKNLRSPRSPASSRKLSGVTQAQPANPVAGSPSISINIPHGQRGRKSSFKDLIARFDSSPEDQPPLVPNAPSLANSTTASPVSYASPTLGNSATSRTRLTKRPPGRRDEYRPNGWTSAIPAPVTLSKGTAKRSSSTQWPDNSHTTSSNSRRPLFGEVLLHQSTTLSAGFGIQDLPQRPSSAGSPSRSPDQLFAERHRQQENQETSVVDQDSLSPFHDHLNPPIRQFQQHRRANSDFTTTAGREALRMNGAHSRIPISTRRHSNTSESEISAPNSRATSKLEKRQQDRTPIQSASKLTKSTTRPGSSKGPRFSNTNMHIRSPGVSSGMVSGEKSPSLRANIIAPPPKISPPLRSSRPRLPVSAASTASSRAKMAERFATRAKEQDEKRASSRRQRPPELSDIDLKARRLKITQALSRSREGQDLRGDPSMFRTSTTSHTSTITPTASGAVSPEPPIDQQANIPSLVVDSTSPMKDGQTQYLSSSERAPFTQSRVFTQSALQAIEGLKLAEANDDSPTLGIQGNPTPARLQTHLGVETSNQDELSAVTQGTADTLGTFIDNEPQPELDETSGNTILSHILSMRDETGTPPVEQGPSDDASDHADEESIQIMLRNTAYLENHQPFQEEKTLPPLPSMPNAFESSSEDRNSWISTAMEDIEPSPQLQQQSESLHVPSEAPTSTAHSETSSVADGNDDEGHHESARETIASDAYTIVNIVLQRHSTAGVVNQQVVDDIYQRIVHEAPHLVDKDDIDIGEVEDLCLKELRNYDDEWPTESVIEPQLSAENLPPSQEEFVDNSIVERHDKQQGIVDENLKISFPPQSFRSHKYKPSLDSAEDWAETSPSVGDWMRFAVDRSPDEEYKKPPSLLMYESNLDQFPDFVDPEDDGEVREASDIEDSIPERPATEPPIRPPSHSPPPVPTQNMPSIEQVSGTAIIYQPQRLSRPQVPRRLTSLSQIQPQSTPTSQNASRAASRADSREQVESSQVELSQEQRRLKQRRHVMKELVDTEYTYERDLRVLCDIYKQTAIAAISDEDIKLLFGNVENVQRFAKDFLTYLKSVVKPAYVMERPDRRKDPRASSHTQASVMSNSDLTDAEKDQQTRVGEAFGSSIVDMEKVYTEYIRTRHAANKRLEALQTIPSVREWLKECRDNSSDITNAWSLDALLVKPIQRITKYPLLLSQLLECTSSDHPDIASLRQVLIDVTEVNVRINEVKKHTELVDQVLNRKRKESDVRNGLTKAFGRRAEKLRQHVGINEMYEDSEYARLKIDFDNNGVHLLIVSKDCTGYVEAIRNWVARTCEVAAAAEAWLDVGHTIHAEAESKLRQFAMAVRGINSIALPDHVDQVLRLVVHPMDRCLAMLDRFKNDPKGLIQKREKRLLDYNQVKNKKDRGERLDRKMMERLEQWEALNVEAKDRMRKLLSTTSTLVQTCQANLINLHILWLNMLREKLSTAMSIKPDEMEIVDILREWQEDFDFQEASAQSLSICNGTLLLEVVNMVNFGSSQTTTLNDEESPPRPSWNSSSNKRSFSLGSEHSPMPTMEFPSRPSNGPTTALSEYTTDNSAFTYSNGRIRTGSTTSGRTPKTPELSYRSGFSAQPSVNQTYSRPGTSTSREDVSGRAPRLSIETPSPFMGPIHSTSSTNRPSTTSTFFSAASGPSQQPSLPSQNPSSFFSSAMPMSNSPMMDRSLPGLGVGDEPQVLFTAASVYEFNIDRSRQECGIPYLTYVAGEIFDVIAERGELWLARNQDDSTRQVGWIWHKHFAKLAE